MKLNCIIIDDEPSSQNILKNFIRDIDFLELIGISNNPVASLQYFDAHPPIDLIFLDINMPKITGLEFYKSLQNPPDVIFTTAYPQYAVEGFEVNAMDYLLKPFSFTRFLTAVNKVREKHLNARRDIQKNGHLMVKSNKVLHKISFDTIFFIEAFGDYIKIYNGDDCIVTNSTFGNILSELPEKQFMRIHKSYAINIDKLNRISGNQALLANHTVPIGQKYKVDFMHRISH